MTGHAGGPTRPRGLALVGYRGTGKSTVGRIVAERLGRPFVDADLALERMLGRPVAAIFRDLGEPAFRDWEQRALAELTLDPETVLATGGGAVVRESNRRALRGFGFVVWLSAEPTVLAERLGADPAAVASRPALTPLGTLDEIAEVLDARRPHYREVADVVVPTDGRTPAEVADLVLRVLPWSWSADLDAD